MSFTKKMGLSVLLATVSWTACAQGFNYNYGQIDYHSGDFDGLGLTGSFVLNNELFIRAGYIGTSDDDAGFDVDYTRLNVGIGLYKPLNQKTDGVVTVSIVNEEVETDAINNIPSRSTDETGLLVTGGVRHQLDPKVELAGELFYIDAIDDDLGLYGEVRYLFKPGLTGGLGITSSDTLDGLSVNLRLLF